LAVLSRLAVRTRRAVEAEYLEREFCAAEAFLQSSAFELVRYEQEEATAAYSVSL
jgi:hypothetical protein